MCDEMLLAKPRSVMTARERPCVSRSVNERFKREVEIGKKVTDPHVCRVYDLGYHPHDPNDASRMVFMSMELLSPGQTLAQRLKNSGPMTPSEALPFIGDIAAGLAALHSHGYIHRDLKSSNIMLVAPADGPEYPAG